VNDQGEIVSNGASNSVGTVPAAAVIAACLAAQSAVPPRSPLARILGRSPLSEDSRSWYLGALGELRVAERLAKLGPGWTVLHSVPIGDRGSDIDHVVLGPFGVFTLNTKLHEGARVWVGGRRLLVNGAKTDHLRNARYEAQRVARTLTALVGEPIEVTAAMVLVGTQRITFRERPTDVAVLRDTELVRWLSRRKTTLELQAQDRLASVLTRPETWWSTASAPVADLPAFTDLGREVRTARRVRLMWGTVALLGGIAAAATFALNTYTAMLGGLVG
jgi:hypothetical protein